MTAWLAYWTNEVADREVMDGGNVGHAASNQLNRLKRGDRLFISTIREGQLRLLGAMTVDRVTDQKRAAAALKMRPDELWDAEFHALARKGSATAIADRDISALASLLRFKATTPTVKIIGGLVRPQALRTMRPLEVESARMLEAALNGDPVLSARRSHDEPPGGSDMSTVKISNDDGVELDAEFDVVEDDNGRVSVVLSGRGGSKGTPSERNTDYGLALRLLLERLQEIGATISGAEVDSFQTRKLPVGERQLVLESPWHYPIRIEDPAELRLVLSRSQAKVGQRSGARGGNTTKRLRLHLDFPTRQPTREAILSALQRRENSDPESATDDPALVEIRANLLRARGMASRPIGNRVPPKVVRKGTIAFVRLPSVVASVLYEANGKCDLCQQPAPFHTPDGLPYLEAHHVRRLADGGSDRVENAVALCPNCHRNLHSGARRSEARERLYALVSRLERE